MGRSISRCGTNIVILRKNDGKIIRKSIVDVKRMVGNRALGRGWVSYVLMIKYPHD